MPQFVAQTSLGLVDVLEKELLAFADKKNNFEIDLQIIEKSSYGLRFEADWKSAYKIILLLRTSTRVLLPLFEFKATNNDQLYKNVYDYNFSEFFSENQTLSIKSTLRDSFFKDQRFVTLKVKDALVDRFRDKTGIRPSIDSKNPNVQLHVRVVENHVSVALDLIGDSLSKRGYRKEQGEAPLREHLAAGLLMIAEWTPEVPLYDPMCGSGTFLIEAALMAQNIAPGTFRTNFLVQNLKLFNEECWGQALDEVIALEKPGEDASPTVASQKSSKKIFGSDINGSLVRVAQANSVRAGVDQQIAFYKKSVSEMTVPPEHLSGQPGIVIVNPPYGERIGIDENLKDVYRDLAFSLKTHFKGWTLWMLSGHEELTGALRLKATRKVKVMNGNIECRFLRYEIKGL